MTSVPARSLLLTVPVLLLASGCASFSGIGGESNLSCPLPRSGNCKPMSQVYEESVGGERSPGAAPINAAPEKDEGALRVTDPQAGALRPVAATVPFTLPGLPASLLSRPRVLRVYIAPWADSKDTLLEGRRAYLKLDGGNWRLDHFRANERKAFAPQPIQPPPEASAAAATLPAEKPAPARWPANPFFESASPVAQNAAPGNTR